MARTLWVGLLLVACGETEQPVAPGLAGVAGATGGDAVEAGAMTAGGGAVGFAGEAVGGSASKAGAAQAGSTAGGAGSSGSPAGGAAGAPIGGGGAGAGAGAGGASGSASGGQGGGSGGAPPNPCDTPDGAPVIDCDGLCGASSSFCSTCSGLGNTVTDTYFLFGPGDTRAGCPCEGLTYRLPVPSLQCVKLTTQPGMVMTFTGTNNACDASARVNGCTVASGISEGSGSEKSVYVVTPAIAGWIRYEVAPLQGLTCPLSCP